MQDYRVAGRHVIAVMNARLGTAFGLDALLSVNHIAVKGVLNVGLATGGPGTVYPGRVGFVVREKDLTPSGSVEVIFAQGVRKLQVGNRRRAGIVGDQCEIVLGTR